MWLATILKYFTIWNRYGEFIQNVSVMYELNIASEDFVATITEKISYIMVPYKIVKKSYFWKMDRQKSKSCKSRIKVKRLIIIPITYYVRHHILFLIDYDYLQFVRPSINNTVILKPGL